MNMENIKSWFSLTSSFLDVGWNTGFEPATSGVTIQHSNHLS